MVLILELSILAVSSPRMTKENNKQLGIKHKYNTSNTLYMDAFVVRVI